MIYMLGTMLRETYGGRVSADEIGLPVTDSGLILPCGATAVWTGEGVSAF